MAWYAFYPSGTLLFKGAEPSDMGADHHASMMFPPPAQTITGALRTAVIVQHGISFQDYYEDNVPPDILAAVGKAGDPAPFQFIGPLFRIGVQVFVPAPFSWFTDKSEKKTGMARVFRAGPTQSRLITAERRSLLFVKGGVGEMVSIGGRWLRLEDLFSSADKMMVYDPSRFYEIEPRTGIALNQNRSARDGHLYTFTHVRLRPDVSLAFGTAPDLPLSDNGFLKIGAEQRFGRYETIGAPTFPAATSGQYVALGLVQGSEKANQTVMATGKIQYIGGWDIKKGFHKPMNGFFPAGSVFSENIHSNFVQL